MSNYFICRRIAEKPKNYQSVRDRRPVLSTRSAVDVGSWVIVHVTSLGLANDKGQAVPSVIAENLPLSNWYKATHWNETWAARQPRRRTVVLCHAEWRPVKDFLSLTRRLWRCRDSGTRHRTLEAISSGETTAGRYAGDRDDRRRRGRVGIPKVASSERTSQLGSRLLWKVHVHQAFLIRILACSVVLEW